MRIVAAAIKVGDLVVSMPKPARHCDILRALDHIDVRAEHPDQQGFLTDTGAFVSRAIAADVERHSARKKRSPVGRELFSENLW